MYNWCHNSIPAFLMKRDSYGDLFYHLYLLNGPEDCEHFAMIKRFLTVPNENGSSHMGFLWLLKVHY